MIIKTMRIKKVYFDAIRRGEKTTEERADKPYYDWLETIDVPFILRLHYQGGVFHHCIVRRVEFVIKPPTALVPTRYRWIMHLSPKK